MIRSSACRAASQTPSHPTPTSRPPQVVVTGECVHQVPQPAQLPPNPTPAELAAASQQQAQNFVSIDPATGAGFTINNPGGAGAASPGGEGGCMGVRSARG